MMNWLSRMLSEEDGQPSTRRVLFTAVILTVLIFCAAHVAIKRGLDAQVIDLVKTLINTTAVAYGFGRAAEALEKK